MKIKRIRELTRHQTEEQKICSSCSIPSNKALYGKVTGTGLFISIKTSSKT